MLLGAVLLWALNITVTKYMLEHGWLPLAYATIRYFAAISIFWIYTWWRERSFRIARADWIYVGIAAAMIFVNQLCFVYSLEFAHASTVSLLFGTCPMFVGLISIVFLHAHLDRSFWIGAGADPRRRRADRCRRRRRARLGLEGRPARDRARRHVGELHGRDRAAHAPLLAVPDQRGRARARLGAARAREHPADRPPGLLLFSGTVWLGFAYAVIGPLFLTNILWFTAVDRVGAPRATIFNNMQPFFGVLFALLILSESIHGLEIAGGVLIFAGIAYERVGRQVRARADRGMSRSPAGACSAGLEA